MLVPAVEIGNVVPFVVPTSTSGLVVVTLPCYVFGWSFEETTGTAAARVALRNARSSDGSSVVQLPLTAGQATRDWPGLPGLWFEGGLFVDVSSGSIQGCVWAMPVKTGG